MYDNIYIYPGDIVMSGATVGAEIGDVIRGMVSPIQGKTTIFKSLGKPRYIYIYMGQLVVILILYLLIYCFLLQLCYYCVIIHF